MHQLAITFFIIIAGISSGAAIRHWTRRRHERLHAAIPRIRKRLQKISLLGFFSVAFFLAIWNLSFKEMALIALPVIGTSIYLIGGLLGYLVAVTGGSNRRQRGTLLCCGAMTNTGALGGLIVYVFLGEIGFGLLMLYKLFEDAIYYGIMFPLAKYFSQAPSATIDIGGSLKGIVTDPLIVVSLLALGGGALFNLGDIPRPEFLGVVSAVCVPVGTTLLLISIGLGLEVGNLRHHLTAGVKIAAIKFLCLPLVALLCAWLLGLAAIADELPLQVVLIASSMPVGFNGIVVSSIYDLDLDLANTCWLVSTGLLVIVLPWLFYLVQ